MWAALQVIGLERQEPSPLSLDKQDKPESQASTISSIWSRDYCDTTDTTRGERHIPSLLTAKELDQQTKPMLQSSYERITALPSTACVPNPMCFTYHPYRSMSALLQAKASCRRHCFLLYSR